VVWFLEAHHWVYCPQSCLIPAQISFILPFILLRTL
jgi:hypothetical protein